MKSHDTQTSGRTEAYSVTISSSTGTAARQFRLSVNRVRALLIAAGILALAGILSVAFLGHLLSETRAAQSLRAENTVLRRQLGRLSDIEERLAVLDSTRRSVLRVVGVEEPEIGPVRELLQEPRGDAQNGTYTIPEPGAEPVLEDLERIQEVLTVIPVPGPLTRGYGPVSESGIFHLGIDVAGQTGAPILAAGEGIVTFVGFDEVFGNVLVLAHGPRLATMYGHASRIMVRVGDFVTAGEKVGEVGNTGRSTAPHLHFEVHWDDKAVNPALVYDLDAGRETSGREESATAVR